MVRVKVPGIVIASALLRGRDRWVRQQGRGRTTGSMARRSRSTRAGRCGAPRASTRRRCSTERSSRCRRRGDGSGTTASVLRALDDSTPQRDEWDPGQDHGQRPHRRSRIRPRSGTSATSTPGPRAVSIPLLNRARDSADQRVEQRRRPDLRRAPGRRPASRRSTTRRGSARLPASFPTTPSRRPCRSTSSAARLPQDVRARGRRGRWRGPGLELRARGSLRRARRGRRPGVPAARDRATPRSPRAWPRAAPTAC